MFGINLKHSLATVAVSAGLLTAAGSASAGVSVYQHNQTDLEFLAVSPQGRGSEGFADGMSNTVMFGERDRARVLMADMGGQVR
jgi:hypothetical protein